MIRAKDMLYPRPRRQTLGGLCQWRTLIFMAALLTGVACSDDDDDDNNVGGGQLPNPPSGGALSVAGTQPPDGATGVSNMAQIQALFSAALDTGTVDASSFAVTGSTSGVIQGAYSFADNDKTALFSPDAPYAYEETVDVRVTTDVISAEGDRLTEDLLFSFTVEEDPTPPLELLGTQPGDGATGVSRMAQIQATFSEVLDEATVIADSFRVTGSTSGTIPGVYSLADVGRTALFSPDAPYAYEETVQVLLTTALASSQGGQLSAASSFSFTVEDDPAGPGPIDDVLATIESTTPEAYEQGVAPDQGVGILFSHPLDPATVTTDTVWLSSPLTGRVRVFLLESEYVLLTWG